MSQNSPNDAPHIPVMLPEVLQVLAPKASDLIVDGTFGAGGYSSAIVQSGAKVIGIDRDPDAIRAGQKIADNFSGRLKLIQGRFAELDELAGEKLDGVVLDIGVSSMQLDEDARGFSFRRDGPLDMRMERSGVSAADVVNGMAREDLTRLIGIWGEERKAGHVSKAIERRRNERPFQTTSDLADVVAKAVGSSRKDRIHPATRTFQALRIFVNQELHQLCAALMAAERALKPGGKLVVVTFHSLEDRIVKRFFADRSGAQQGSRHLPDVAMRAAQFNLPSKKVLSASEDEILRNPRARSAKLRFGMRADVPFAAQDWDVFGLPNLPDLNAFGQSATLLNREDC